MDWAGTLDRLARLDFTHIIMGHGDVVGRDWLKTFRAYVHDMVAAVCIVGALVVHRLASGGPVYAIRAIDAPRGGS